MIVEKNARPRRPTLLLPTRSKNITRIPALVFACVLVLGSIVAAAAPAGQSPVPTGAAFQLEEATIPDIQRAIMRREITATDVVERYLTRIQAYNGTCVDQPDGILGVVTPIPHAGQINALMTLNLRPANRIAWGFDDHKARSMTDPVDNDANMPDALEVAAQLDAQFAETGRLVGPLHGVVLAIKDAYDTFDMRTTSGADAFYANDRPPHDATFVEKLRAAGAIILAKSNMAEYQGGVARSSFGGVNCNPYDTERDPGASSGGSASAVAANLVTCAMAEESSGSITYPAANNNIVGLAPEVALVSRHGMIGAQPIINDRAGPVCRTVADLARILTVIAGYDPQDPVTAFSVGRLPAQPYESFATAQRLDGIRIGVMREHMDKDLFSPADFNVIDTIDRALDDLRALGATIVDPGPHGALMQDCVARLTPALDGRLFTSQFPELFPVDADGNPSTDQIPLLLDMAADPSLFPAGPTIRNLGPAVTLGTSKYKINAYLKERGDTNIQTEADLITKANFYSDPNFPDRAATLQANEAATTLDTVNSEARYYTLQMIAHQCMAQLGLDAIVHPTSNIPPYKLGAPAEPTVNDRLPRVWNVLPGSAGFPVISVPAGFTTEVYARVPDPSSPGDTLLVGPTPATLPVGMSILARPFDEPTLLKIASAYEAGTHHRTPPPDFGPLPQ